MYLYIRSCVQLQLGFARIRREGKLLINCIGKLIHKHGRDSEYLGYLHVMSVSYASELVRLANEYVKGAW